MKEMKSRPEAKPQKRQPKKQQTKSRHDASSAYCRTRSSVGTRAAEAPPSPLELRILGTPRRVCLNGPRFTVGTGSSNNLVLVDPYTSKHHCTLLTQQDGLWIQDEDSRNGTWVNDLRVERCRVWPGARIVIGRTSLELQSRVQHKRGSYGIIGVDPTIRLVVKQIQRLGPSRRPVLILGETGTGKELVARALHAASPCRTHAFEPLNCSAIPRELAESEFFGHVEGAFTGAKQDRKGAFERADGGTLFLDEVGEMPLELQPKLLRVLEDRAVQRIGDDDPRPVEVRVVAATHRNLAAEAERGSFRLDLYHRLAFGVVLLPPLRERTRDVPLLVDHFLALEAAKKGLTYLPHLADDVMPFLCRQPWPGNVRQLRHAVERAVLEGDPELTVRHFGLGKPPRRQGEVSRRDMVRFRGREFRDIQRDVYLKVLDEHGGNRTAAAAALGIPKSTFFDQLKALGIRQAG
jgi:DNA-binding NtrC family response regulator